MTAGRVFAAAAVAVLLVCIAPMQVRGDSMDCDLKMRASCG
jgi:hypothetical protein